MKLQSSNECIPILGHRGGIITNFLCWKRKSLCFCLMPTFSHLPFIMIFLYKEYNLTLTALNFCGMFNKLLLVSVSFPQAVKIQMNFNIFSIKCKAYLCAGIFPITKTSDILLGCYEWLYLKNNKVYKHLFLNYSILKWSWNDQCWFLWKDSLFNFFLYWLCTTSPCKSTQEQD